MQNRMRPALSLVERLLIPHQLATRLPDSKSESYRALCGPITTIFRTRTGFDASNRLHNLDLIGIEKPLDGPFCA